MMIFPLLLCASAPFLHLRASDRISPEVRQQAAQDLAWLNEQDPFRHVGVYAGSSNCSGCTPDYDIEPSQTQSASYQIDFGDCVYQVTLQLQLGVATPTTECGTVVHYNCGSAKCFVYATAGGLVKWTWISGTAHSNQWLDENGPEFHLHGPDGCDHIATSQAYAYCDHVLSKGCGAASVSDNWSYGVPTPAALFVDLTLYCNWCLSQP